MSWLSKLFSKADPPPAPDLTPIVNAQREMAQYEQALSREQFEWAKQAYAQDREVSDRVINSFLDTQRQNDEWARRDRARYEGVFQPMEDRLAKEALDYSSPERMDMERGRAQAAVAQQFDAARNAATQELESYGINPSATRYAALDMNLRAQRAAASAAAANQSDLQTEATGRALRSEAINVGRGYPGTIAGTQNTGMQAGTGAVNSGLATTGSGANTMGTGTQYAGLANSGFAGAGTTMNQGYSNQIAAFKAKNEASTGLGALLGAGTAAAGQAAKMAMMFIEDGGAVDPNMVPPGASPSGGQAVDDVPARLTVGEYVIPADVVAKKGQDFFDRLIMSIRKTKEQPKPKMGQALPMPPTYASPGAQALPVG